MIHPKIEMVCLILAVAVSFQPMHAYENEVKR